VTGVLAQRLVRVICPKCKTEETASPQDLVRFGLPRDTVVYAGTGCAACRQTGFAGRTAIGEALSMDDNLAEALLERPRTRALHKIASRMGMKPLLRQGVLKVREGITTLGELQRVLPVELADQAENEAAAGEESVES
jgi:type II secretory ATPase GspE/PulE/Tfp pilus assembly ATPase PilB-like protein